MFEQTVLGLLVVYDRDDYERSFPAVVNLVPDCKVLLKPVLFVVPLAVLKLFSIPISKIFIYIALKFDIVLQIN